MSITEEREPKDFGFIPLEEKIVLDATLVFDIGQVTFLQEDHTLDYSDSLDNDLDDISNTPLFFDSLHLQDEGIDHGTSALSEVEEGYSDFIVHNEPIYLQIDQGESHSDYNLTEAYPAGDLLIQMGFLSFQVSQNSNPDLVSAEVDNTILKLDYGESESGNADLIVRGTYLDGKVYDTPFHIHVAAANDGQFDYDTTSGTISPWMPVFYDDASIDAKTAMFSLELTTHSTNSEALGSLIAESQEAVHEINGFFGKPSFEEGNWVNAEIADSK
ncbi:MAG: hypothetical protein ACE5GN_05215 [Waddliaceae bacterium]